jgi:hypothetical protein
LWRKPARHAKADNPGAIAEQQAGFCDRCCKRGRQITAVAPANDLHFRARSDAGLKRQSNDNNQEPPAPLCGLSEQRQKF